MPPILAYSIPFGLIRQFNSGPDVCRKIFPIANPGSFCDGYVVYIQLIPPSKDYLNGDYLLGDKYKIPIKIIPTKGDGAGDGLNSTLLLL